jgi:hypothetical protein
VRSTFKFSFEKIEVSTSGDLAWSRGKGILITSAKGCKTYPLLLSERPFLEENAKYLPKPPKHKTDLLD